MSASKIIWPIVLLALAGCSTVPRPAPGSRAPDWSVTNQESTVHVPEAPVLAPPPAAAPAPPMVHTNAPAPMEAWVSLERWNRERHIGSLRQIRVAPTLAYSLTTSNGVLVIQIKSQVAKWNNVELHFAFEPQLIDGRPFVQALDLKKNIEPLLQSLVLPARDRRIIVLDPGHGGPLPGAASVLDGSFEKEFTLDWAKRAAPLLARHGWTVFLTRTNDVDIALSNRVAFAEAHKADLFVSLHFNSAAPNQEQAGLETFCLTPTGLPSTLTRNYPDDVTAVFPNNNFDEQNLEYALRLHRALLSVCQRDRGVRHARFLGVLRGQQRPAVLIEGGYLSNPQEARRIADPAFRQRLAEMLAEALNTDVANPASEPEEPPTAVHPVTGGSNEPSSTLPSPDDSP